MATKTTIEMAREAAGDDWGLFQEFMPEIHKLVELVRADERARMATDKSKEAMKLALEALSGVADWVNVRTKEHPWDQFQRVAPAITALREELAEQPAQQELVATITITQRGPIRIVDNNFDDCVRKWPDGEYKLYTSPPAQRTWVGLSDLNIDELENEYMKSAQTAHEFLRAIEAKLKEKNT